LLRRKSKKPIADETSGTVTAIKPTALARFSLDTAGFSLRPV
jgi:hypothetical protein